MQLFISTGHLEGKERIDIHIYVCICIHTYTYMHTYIHVCLHLCLCVCVCAHLCTCVHVQMSGPINLIKLRSRIETTETHSIISFGVSKMTCQIKRINLK